MKDARITVRFPEAIKNKLDEEADKRGWNLSQLLREIVKDYFTAADTEKKPANRMLNQDINYFNKTN